MNPSCQSDNAMNYLNDIINHDHGQTSSIEQENDHSELDVIETIEELQQLNYHNSLFSESEYRMELSENYEQDLYNSDACRNTDILENLLKNISQEQENLNNVKGNVS